MARIADVMVGFAGVIARFARVIAEVAGVIARVSRVNERLGSGIVVLSSRTRLRRVWRSS